MPTIARRTGLGLLVTALLAFAQIPAQIPSQGQQPPSVDPGTKAALHQLAEDLAELREQRDQTTDAARAQALSAQIEALRWEFAELAAHLDVQEFEQPADRRIELEREVLELVDKALN